jgi:hypothetical protein
MKRILIAALVMTVAVGLSGCPVVSKSVPGDNISISPQDGTGTVVISAEERSGQPGPAGPQGVAGQQGTAGAVGAAGAAGAVGAAGPTGEVGPQGSTGIEGPAGVSGATGVAGVAGPTGPQGLGGSQGEVGPEGQKGDTGAQGETGVQGLKGDTGPQGVPGPVNEPRQPVYSTGSGAVSIPDQSWMLDVPDLAIKGYIPNNRPTLLQLVPSGMGIEGNGTIKFNGHVVIVFFKDSTEIARFDVGADAVRNIQMPCSSISTILPGLGTEPCDISVKVTAPMGADLEFWGTKLCVMEF